MTSFSQTSSVGAYLTAGIINWRNPPELKRTDRKMPSVTKLIAVEVLLGATATLSASEYLTSTLMIKSVKCLGRRFHVLDNWQKGSGLCFLWALGAASKNFSHVDAPDLEMIKEYAEGFFPDVESSLGLFYIAPFTTQQLFPNIDWKSVEENKLLLLVIRITNQVSTFCEKDRRNLLRAQSFAQRLLDWVYRADHLNEWRIRELLSNLKKHGVEPTDIREFAAYFGWKIGYKQKKD